MRVRVQVDESVSGLPALLTGYLLLVRAESAFPLFPAKVLLPDDAAGGQVVVGIPYVGMLSKKSRSRSGGGRVAVSAETPWAVRLETELVPFGRGLMCWVCAVVATRGAGLRF